MRAWVTSRDLLRKEWLRNCRTGFVGVGLSRREDTQVDRNQAFKEVWRPELLARLVLLDQVISEQASRGALMQKKGWDATLFEKRSELLQLTRNHYIELLNQLLSDGQLPMLWSDLDPDAAANSPASTP